MGYRRLLGYVPEEPYLYAHLSGLEHLTMVSQLRSLPERAASGQIGSLLHLLSLHGDRHAATSGYSKGMRQTLLLAGALLHNPNRATSFNPEEFAPKKQTISAEGKARISAAQKKRWAAQKACVSEQALGPLGRLSKIKAGLQIGRRPPQREIHWRRRRQ